MHRLITIIAVIAIILFFIQPAQAQGPYARAFGFSASPWGYQYQTTAVPLPTYSGYGSYILPQTNYQIQSYYNNGYNYNNGYAVPAVGYTYQLPSIFQGSSGYFVPNYGW